MRWLFEVYKEHLAYEYFRPGLMQLTYGHLDASTLLTMLLILLVFCLIYGAIPLALWGVESLLTSRGRLHGRARRASRKILIAAFIVAFLAALNTANNLLLSINN